MSSLPRSARVTFTAASEKRSLVAYVGEEGVTVGSDSYGGFEVVDRPLRTGIVTWGGHQPLSMTVPLLIDNFEENDGLATEKDIATLEFLAGRGDGAGGEPPEVKLEAAGQLVPHQDVPFVINGLEWGDAIRNDYGNRIRQFATVTVLQNVSPKTLATLEKKRKANNRSKTYTVKKGDSLHSIAAKQLGDRDLWQKIADLNNINDVRSLRTGMKLKLPSVTKKKG